MIVYKIDKQAHTKTNTKIREMAAVLAEIAPTLQTLHDLLMQHEQTITSPSITRYREELQELISQATVITRDISDQSQKLVAVSDQAGKHLAAIEEHFGTVLQQSSTKTDEATISA